MQCAASPLEKAGIKLGRARAVADLVFALDSHEGYDDVDSSTIGNAMVLVRELIDEARELMPKAEAQP
jgi:hypothetical protein